MSHERSATAGMRNTATCAADASAISRGERDLAAVGDDDGPAVLRRVPDDRDDHGRDEELAEPDLVGEDLDRADEDLGDERRRDGREGQNDERRGERPAVHLARVRDVDPRVPAERVPGHADVDHKERDRDRHGQGGQAVAVRIAAPAGDRGDEEQDRRDREQPEREEARQAVERSPPACDESRAEDEEEVRDDAARERATHDLGQPIVHREQRDDELGRVAEGRVEEAADTGARVLCSVLGGLADDPRERDERDRGEHELGGPREVGEIMQGDHDRRDRQACEEDPPHHRRGNLSAWSRWTAVVRSATRVAIA